MVHAQGGDCCGEVSVEGSPSEGEEVAAEMPRAQTQQELKAGRSCRHASECESPEEGRQEGREVEAELQALQVALEAEREARAHARQQWDAQRARILDCLQRILGKAQRAKKRRAVAALHSPVVAEENLEGADESAAIMDRLVAVSVLIQVRSLCPCSQGARTQHTLCTHMPTHVLARVCASKCGCEDAAELVHCPGAGSQGRRGI